jgi:hypothetical protein
MSELSHEQADALAQAIADTLDVCVKSEQAHLIYAAFAETQRSSNATRSDEQTSPTVQPPAPEPLTKALKEAAQSLRSVERLAGRGEYMMEFSEVRSYAGSRAKVAEGALAVPSITQRGAALTDEQIIELFTGYSHRKRTYERHGATLLEFRLFPLIDAVRAALALSPEGRVDDNPRGPCILGGRCMLKESG